MRVKGSNKTLHVPLWVWTASSTAWRWWLPRPTCTPPAPLGEGCPCGAKPCTWTRARQRTWRGKVSTEEGEEWILPQKKKRLRGWIVRGPLRRSRKHYCTPSNVGGCSIGGVQKTWKHVRWNLFVVVEVSSERNHILQNEALLHPEGMHFFCTLWSLNHSSDARNSSRGETVTLKGKN